MCVSNCLSVCVHILMQCLERTERKSYILKLGVSAVVVSHLIWVMGTKLGAFAKPVCALKY